MSRPNVALQQALAAAMDAPEAEDWDEQIVVLDDPNAGLEKHVNVDGEEDGENGGADYAPTFPTERPSEKDILAAMEVEDDWDEEEDCSGGGARMATSPRAGGTSSHARGTSMTLGDVSQRARYIPLRLTYEERKDLRRVNAAINVSEYTTSVDRSFRNEVKRTCAQLQAICAFLSGIVASKGNTQCQQVLRDRNLEDFEQLFKEVLEIARRYKITNPEKMRSEYGKLVYLMQDAMSSSLQPLLQTDIHIPVHTVYSMLEQNGALAMLRDPAIRTATREIRDDKSKTRAEIQAMIRKKEKARRAISTNRAYQQGDLTQDDLERCLYSIGDNDSFLNSNRLPVDTCIALLQEYFHPDSSEDGYSLAIDEGADGSRLTHSHTLQYNYVLQSLTLWRNIIDDLFRLWYLAEQDLLSDEHPYELKNTGQGLQRVQPSPRVYRAMQEILGHTQQQLGGWVGSSMIHLGDHNVPNTLVFIDKYTQVAKILGPLINVLAQLEYSVEGNEGLKRYMQAYGGLEKAKKDILHDFFRYGFDGSGGDNDFDAGSCIDGRLTSAWHWCSTLASKPYYPLFRLTGFLSFDGEFDR